MDWAVRSHGYGEIRRLAGREPDHRSGPNSRHGEPTGARTDGSLAELVVSGTLPTARMNTIRNALCVLSQGGGGVVTTVMGSAGNAALATPTRPRPGILLDRDGTIIVDHGHVGSIDRVEFVDGAPEAIASFNRAGVPVAVVTNQSGVARGFYSVDDVALVHQHIAAGLFEYGARIDMFLYCPYHPAGVVEAFARTSEDRKPAPGMAKAAAAALNLDLTASWIVGDRPEDIGLAEAVGASAVFLGNSPAERRGVWSFPSLAAAAPFILERIAA